VNKLLCCVLLVSGAAIVQTTMAQAPPPQTPANEDLEPGVNTSAPGTAPQTPATTPPRATTPSTTQPGDAPRTNDTTARPATNNAAATRRRGAQDRLDLEATQITGNRELPKVLYIVPWRSAELGDLVGRPVNSLLDEVLEPVDRDVFRRQNRYFEALQPNEAAPAGKPEK
jgi:hypothetical protein